MQHFIMAALVTICSTAACGAEFLAAKAAAKRVETETCNDMACMQTGKVTVSYSGKLKLAPDEEAALVTGSTVAVGYLGVDFEFQLGSDVGFQDGDTSVEVTTDAQDLPPDYEGIQTLRLSWKNGILTWKVRQSISGMTASVHFPSLSAKQRGPKTGSKEHAENPYLDSMYVSLTDPGDNNIFSAEALVVVNSREKQDEKYNGLVNTHRVHKATVRSTGLVQLD